MSGHDEDREQDRERNIRARGGLTDREHLKKIAGHYREFVGLIDQQKQTTALMVRACLQRLRSTDPRKRAEAIKGLEDLAEMLETPR